ncbi:MAG: hypothetical protein ACKOD9_12840, partial [Rubrivivax sp.]
MTSMLPPTGLQLRSTITSGGELELTLVDEPVAHVRKGCVVGGSLCLSQVRVAAQEQAADAEVG